MNTLTQAQPAQTQQVEQPVVSQGENINAVNQTSAPETGVAPEAQKAENNIPYHRFKQVIDQKNNLESELSQYRAAFQQMQQPQGQAQQSASQMPQFETTDDLVNYVNSMVEKKLQSANEQYVKPLSNTLTNMTFNNQIERYFSSPDKAQYRQAMDAYTATMSPEEQSFIKQTVLRGDYKWLDNIYHAVKTEQQNNVNQMVNQNVQQQANAAASPNPYKVLRTAGDESINDKLAQAKRARMEGNRRGAEQAYMDIFSKYKPKM